MKRVQLSAAGWDTPEKAHADLAQALSFPDYYGHNLDALHDCLTDLRDVTVVLRNAGAMTGALGDYGDKVLRVFRDSAEENPGFGFVEL